MRRGAIAGLLALACGGVLGTGCGEDRATIVRAEFKNAGGLRPGSLVRVGGAGVGSVRSLRVTSRDTAEVTLKLEAQVVPGAGASAAIRAANLLGEKFVDLSVGDRARPLRSLRIPLSRTSTPVELDDVLDVLDPTTRGRLGLLVGELGTALGGRGRDIKAALRVLPGTVADAGKFLDELAADTRVLERLLEEADRVAVTVARERRSLGTLVATGARALEAPSAHRAGLGRTLRAAPGLLMQLRATLRRLDRAGTALRPASRGLRATAPALERTLRALPGFDSAATPTLATVTEVAPSLARLGRRAAPVVRRLRPTANSLRDLAIDAEPLTKTLDNSAANLLSVMQNWAMAIQTRDSASHLFRVSLSLTPDMLRQLDAYVTGPARRSKEGRPTVGRRAPSVTTRPLATTKPVERTVDRAVGPLKDTVDAVKRAPEPLLDFLLGR